MADAGRLILIAGVVLVLVGAFFMAGGRIPFLGRLPGDLSFRSGNTQVFIPIATSILLSVVLTLILNLFFRGR